MSRIIQANGNGFPQPSIQVPQMDPDLMDGIRNGSYPLQVAVEVQTLRDVKVLSAGLAEALQRLRTVETLLQSYCGATAPKPAEQSQGADET